MEMLLRSRLLLVQSTYESWSWTLARCQRKLERTQSQITGIPGLDRTWSSWSLQPDGSKHRQY